MEDLEKRRVDALNAYRIMHSAQEEQFNSIARLAAVICDKPMATITFLDEEEQFIKSSVGLECGTLPVSESVCQYTILQSELLEIPDTSLDPRTADLSTLKDLGIRFYAGVPLVSPEGFAVGSICVMDTVPSVLTDVQRRGMQTLAEQVIVNLELRRKNQEVESVLKNYDEIATIFNNSAELHLITDRQGTLKLINNNVEKLLGYTPEEGIGRPIWEFMLEEDIRRMLPIVGKGLSEGLKHFELEGRIRLKNGGTRWMGWSVSSKGDSWYVNGRDISEYKALIAELEQLSLVANKVDNGVVISDGESKVIWANEATEKITGYELADLKGRKLGDILAGERTDVEVIKNARELTKNKKSFAVDLLVHKKDGTPIWVSVLNSVILDNEGNIHREVEVIIDITARKQAEQELQTLSLVASKSSSGVIIRDGEGRVTWVNDATEQLLGYRLEELAGKKMSEVVVGPDTDMSAIRQSQEAIANKKAYTIEVLVYKKNGDPVWLQCSTTPIIDDEGEIEKQVEIINDITERKNNEEELTLLSLVASKTVNGVAISTADGKIKWVNKALEDLTGYTLEEFRNTRPGDLLSGPGTDMELLERARKQASNCIPSNIELLSYRKDGTPIWLMISNTPTFNKDGSLDQQVEIINDISERKQAEQELIKTREEALQLSKAKETFLSVMSHEIRTPLNAVIGMSHILMDDDPTESQKENLKILSFSAQNLLTLINDVLDFTKIETGNMVLESANVNLKHLVSQTLNSLQFKTTEKEIALRSEIDYRIPQFVKGDNTRLYQILINLLGNAVKFTDEGEVKLKLDLVGETKTNVKVRFEVSDTGIGIPEDKLDHIFESYTQANSDTTRKYGGTGLGLAITKRLVQLHRSEIEVKSTVGEGSSFSFVISFDRAQELVMETETSQSVSNLDANILVVDDNEINRILARKVLVKWGVRVDMAENGRQALEMVQTKKYDLILMDLHMPVMDGMESARSMRALGGDYRNIPIIALTASLFSHELETISSSGMNGYVMKPFVPQELYQKIKAFLR